MLKKIFWFFARWQESSVWLPLLVIVAVLGWLVLGALDRTAGADSLAMLVQLPILTGFALAALAMTHLARRRWRRKLTAEEQQAWWDGVMAGQLGPLTVLWVDAIFSMVLICALLEFFSLVFSP